MAGTPRAGINIYPVIPYFASQPVAAVGTGQLRILVTQPCRPPQPSPHLCCPWGGFSAPSRGAAVRSPAPVPVLAAVHKELFMSRPRSAHSGCFVRGALAAHSPKKGSVCGGKGVPEAACPSLAVPKGPRHLFNPRLLSRRRGLAMLAVAGGAQGVWGAAPHLFSQPTLLEMGAGEQLECLASWGAAALTSHVLSSCYSCCSGKWPGHKEARPLSPSPAHQCRGALLCFPGTAKAAEDSLGCVGCSGQHAGSCPCP